MSEFWETFAQGCEIGVEVMGEDVQIGNLDPMKGTVRPVEVRDVVVTGGVSVKVSHEIEVSLEAGSLVQDGMSVVARSMTGKVVYKEHFGGGWVIYAGPENRWTEEEY